MAKGFPPGRPRAVPSRLQIAREFFRLPPWEGYRTTPKRVRNLLRSRYEWLRGRKTLTAYPIRLTIEPFNACNLRCPACLTGLGELGRPRSPMSLALYHKILDELGDYLFELEFTNWGEPLLCKELPQMVRAASDRGISTTVVTNLSLSFDAERAEALVGSGLAVLGVSIDGARQESYEQYRRRGNLALVLDNCSEVNEAKRRLGSKTPRVVWSFHAFPHNTGDVALAQRLAAERGMEFAATKGAVLAEEWGRETDWRFFGEPRPMRCPYLWAFAVLNNDGGVPPCQGAFYSGDDMGRVSAGRGEPGAASFMEVWNGARFRAARSLFDRRRATPETEDLLCLNCPVTLLYEELQGYLRRGGRRRAFEVRYTTNDAWKFFIGRRFAASAHAQNSTRKAS